MCAIDNISVLYVPTYEVGLYIYLLTLIIVYYLTLSNFKHSVRVNKSLEQFRVVRACPRHPTLSLGIFLLNILYVAKIVNLNKTKLFIYHIYMSSHLSVPEKTRTSFNFINCTQQWRDL